MQFFVWAVRWGSAAALVAMVGTSVLVLSAYALPALTIDVSPYADAHHPFRFWHGVLMVPTIPPVVCSLLVCYALVRWISGGSILTHC